MSLSPSIIKEKLDQAVSAWETLRPTKSFGGMTLDQFKAKVKPSYDARVALDSLDNQRTAAMDQRDHADTDSSAALLLVVNSVKGDPAEGEDGELYEAMGYVRKSERQSGLHRSASQPPPAAKA